MRPSSAHPSGVTHENTRHTTRFTVIGNHLAQHRELSLLAIGLACHLQSLPTGAPADIKSLAARFPEGPTRIAAALRELETHGYLRRERVRTPAGRIVTRTVSCNQPRTREATRRHEPVPVPVPETETVPAPPPDRTPARSEKPRTPRKKRPLPPVPQPARPAPALLQQATDLLSGLRRHHPDLLLSACDTTHLAPGVAAWLERDVTPTALRHALTADLPPEGMRRPAALLAHRLTAHLPPPPPFRAPADPPPVRHPLRNCDGCDRAFRAPEAEVLCRDCRTSAGDARTGTPPGRTPPTSTDQEKDASMSAPGLPDRPGRPTWPMRSREDSMSTRADHGHELVPRPEQTPDALRAARAVTAPKAEEILGDG